MPLICEHYLYKYRKQCSIALHKCHSHITDTFGAMYGACQIECACGNYVILQLACYRFGGMMFFTYAVVAEWEANPWCQVEWLKLEEEGC